jgi:hypothetical protein
VNAWWGLLALAASLTIKGAGSTIAQIGGDSSAGLKLAEYGVRTGGLYLTVAGVLAGAILVFAFRRERRWAWWVMWTLPALAFAQSALEYRGVPGPAITAAVVGALAVGCLVLSAPPFFQLADRQEDGNVIRIGFDLAAFCGSRPG